MTDWAAEWRKGWLQLEDESVAEWWGRTHDKYYHRWVMNSDYPVRVLANALPYIGKSSSVLEVGAGTGGFTVHLGRAAGRVTAVEPAERMADTLEARLAGERLSNVRVVRAYIENAEVEPHDVVFGSHCFYDMPIEVAIPRIIALAKERVILATTLGDKHMTVRAGLKHRYRPCAVSYVVLYNLIHDLGYLPSVEFAEVQGQYWYASKDEFFEHWESRFHGTREEFERSPGCYLVPVDDGYTLPFGYVTAVISFAPVRRAGSWYGPRPQ
ncbi:MAG: class I SAM-dependent methyltransferase [Planctomycetota bacterium]